MTVRPPTEQERTDPREAGLYARDVIKGRWPEGEPVIAKDPVWAGIYAAFAFKGRWPEAEATIASDPEGASTYARYVINGPWPAGEPAIAKDSWWAYLYARERIKGRFPAGEPAIATDPDKSFHYAWVILKGRWPEGEPAIAKDPKWAYCYAKEVVKGRWPAGETAIGTDERFAYDYTKFLAKHDPDGYAQYELEHGAWNPGPESIAAKALASARAVVDCPANVGKFINPSVSYDGSIRYTNPANGTVLTLASTDRGWEAYRHVMYGSASKITSAPTMAALCQKLEKLLATRKK